MKKGQAVGPDDIPVEAWKRLVDKINQFNTNLRKNARRVENQYLSHSANIQEQGEHTGIQELQGHSVDVTHNEDVGMSYRQEFGRGGHHLR